MTGNERGTQNLYQSWKVEAKTYIQKRLNVFCMYMAEYTHNNVAVFCNGDPHTVDTIISKKITFHPGTYSHLKLPLHNDQDYSLPTVGEHHFSFQIPSHHFHKNKYKIIDEAEPGDVLLQHHHHHRSHRYFYFMCGKIHTLFLKPFMNNVDHVVGILFSGPSTVGTPGGMILSVAYSAIVGPVVLSSIFQPWSMAHRAGRCQLAWL